MTKQKNKFLNINANAVGMSKYRDDFSSQLSKFIHCSWIIKEDLDREVTVNGVDYTIWGLYDIHHSRYHILLKPVGTGAFLIEDSKVVAHALGYSRMRNLVTGVERQFDFWRKGKVLLETKGDSKLDSNTDHDSEGDVDTAGEWVSSKKEEYVDPLIKAMQDDLIDDGDTSAY
jgi:hypothetical protein